jgi:hypothetical protein
MEYGEPRLQDPLTEPVLADGHEGSLSLIVGPNPARGSVDISYTLPGDSRISVAVYDVAGHEITILVDGREAAGCHRVIWSGTDGKGHEVSNGLYFCRIVTPTSCKMRKILLVR